MMGPVFSASGAAFSSSALARSATGPARSSNGSASAVLDAHAQKGGGYFDLESDDIFYNTKGKLYGYYVILNAIGEDFADVIKEKQGGETWASMLLSLRTGAGMAPLIVVNGDPDALTMPSHLRAIGFPLLRARIQMREMGDIAAEEEG